MFFGRTGPRNPECRAEVRRPDDRDPRPGAPSPDERAPVKSTSPSRGSTTVAVLGVQPAGEHSCAGGLELPVQDVDARITVSRISGGGGSPSGWWMHAFVQNLRRGHCELGVDVDPRHRLPTAFTELARTICI